MTRTIRLVATTLFICGAAMLNSPSSAQQGQTIGGYVKVSELRVTRTVSEFVFRAALTNTGPALSGATAIASGVSGAMTIVEGSLTFGPVGPGGTVVSLDTFTFRQDRTVPFDFSKLLWNIVPTAGNQPPLANAGPDQAKDGIGVLVQLDGSASSDPNGDPLRYQWMFTQSPIGSAATLSGPTSARPTFVPSKKGTYVAQLVVDDGTTSSAPDSVSITVGNTRPVANAGPDQTAGVGAAMMLNGGASSDADGDVLSYTWDLQSRPAGSLAVLQNAASVTPTFTIDVPGNYVARLVVFDGTANSLADLVVVSTENSAPVADAGPDQTVSVAQTVTLDGSASSDVDGNTLTFAWTLVAAPAGSTAALSNPTAVRPTFVTDKAGTYRFQLVVRDAVLASQPDVVEVSTQNSAPVANAGANQTVPVATIVALDGSGSTDVDGGPLTYSWSFTSTPPGSAATLSDATAIKPTFIADTPGVYVAQLLVSDGITTSAPDLAMITTRNSAPLANAGPDQSAIAGRVVFLDGTGSSDVDHDSLTFQWAFTTRPAGSQATLVGPRSAGPSFTADVPGTYVVQLIVNDGQLPSVADTVTISTTNSAPVASAGPDQLDLSAGSLATLTGLASSDADGHALSYHWSLLSKPLGSTATIAAPTAVSPTFLADLIGDYVAQLIVNDGFVDSAPDTVLIRAVGTTLPVVTIDALDGVAAEAGPNTGTLRFTRSGGDLSSALIVSYTIGGTATNGTDFTLIAASITIPANQSSASRIVNPLADNLVEQAETVSLTVSSSASYRVGVPATAQVTIADDPAVVQIGATDPDASEVGANPGAFTLTRSGGDLSSALQVSISMTGTATAGADYLAVGSVVTIPATQTSALITITPVGDALVEGDETVVAGVNANGSYTVGSSGTATVTIHDAPGTVSVSVVAVDAAASEIVPDVGTLRFTRTGGTTSPLTVVYSIAGTATNGTDYGLLSGTAVIPAGQASIDVTVTPVADLVRELSETVVATVTTGTGYAVGTPATGTVTIVDTDGECAFESGTLVNGATHCGAIATAREVDTWTFAATVGDRIAIHIGEVTDNNDYRPWIRLLGPTGTVLVSTSGTDAAAIDGVAAPATGTYQVLVASFDSLTDGTGTYRLTMTHTPSPITISAGDQGGPLDNGAMHTGAIFKGDLDVWTFTATAGDRIAVHVGEMVDNNDFRPWIRLWSPTGAILASTSGTDAAAIDGVAAPVTGTYLVLVASFDSGVDGSGTYRLTMTHTPGPIAVSAGDEGGPLTNGGLHTGEIVQGDLDVWTFTATAGDRIAVHVGQIDETDDFRPWIRLWAPNGAILGSTSGTDGAAIDGAVAPVTGTYLVLVGSFDSGTDGTGHYRLTMTHTPGPITVSTGDQGGPLTNGAMHTGEILQGDLDVWTFTATAGDRIAVHVGEVVDNNDFRPWIRLWSPTGANLASTSGTDAAAIDGVAAPVTGTYLVLVASFDSGVNGNGTYRLTMTHTPGPITVSAGDEGGPLTNGGLHTGEIVQGDLDVWTFTATAGDRIAVHVGQIDETDDFRPWIRLWAPNGAILGSTSGTDGAAIDGAVAPVTGTYLVLVGSFDSGTDGTGHYRLTMTHTPGPITVSAGDEGGPLTNGAMHTGEILQGDLDVWTFTATAGDRIAVHVGEMVDNNDFRPWIRLWSPTGASLASTSGTDAAAIDGVAAPVTGTYLVLVASFDSGVNGNGTYRLTMARTPGPITVSAGDEGGPLTNGGLHTGEIVQGDLDVWTFTANVGDRIAVHVGEILDTDDFRPWIRLWAPNGAILASQSGTDAAAIDGAIAPVTGTYLVLVGSFDSGTDGTGTYRLTMTHTPGPITVSAGDEGGPLTNGGQHTGEILQGDLDVWTFTATAGDRIALHVGEITDTDDFRPWIRLWSPTGASLGSTSGTDAAAIDGAIAPVTGTYLVLVGSFDSGTDGTGTYRLTMTHTPGPITVSAGDQGGPVTIGAVHSGEIVQGDLDVWTVNAVAGSGISVRATQTSETDDFRPWVRVWAPNGASIGSASGLDVGTVSSVSLPVTGTYLILVGSFDSGVDGTGTYSLTVTP